ncbi:dTDP-4-dehydrorhamnose reductase [Aquicoccus sp. G2-2]|uniref:dTDP-4-dehydrorhamnose reductase n=1 Tax=Aquicoccus sp. G2-2 TaxID=3092120 RepID=UPI002ADF74E1|nr:dTDP-4-dehydrorhamnose reductase [Aquicoccus sp. G2-2]MEA1114177.1 dTDP-4-dehydrorhamnose reductase [Aquicoccus sp. G2-2]
MLLIFGKSGQVASELAHLAPEARFLSRAEVDLGAPATCAAAIRNLRPSAVINAAAYTAVDKAETEEALATTINADAPGMMAKACADLNIPLVHISTDYVFGDGGSVPHAPDDPTAPINAYGRSKLAGEVAVRAAGGPHAILRTSWVFSAFGANFVKTMLRLSETRDTLSIVDDQVGGPTPAADIARACLVITKHLHADPALSGTYHFSGAPNASWADLATEIFAQTGRDVAVTGIPTAAYPTPARRPLNSRLACSTTEATFGLGSPDWRAGLATVLHDLQKAAK